MTALSDLLAIPLDAEERAVLADLRQRYDGDRYEREAVAYLTGAVQRVAPRVRRVAVTGPRTPEAAYAADVATLTTPPVYDCQPPEPYWLLRGKSQWWYALVAGRLTEAAGKSVEVREPYPGEEPGCTYYDAPARAGAVRYAEGLIAGGPGADGMIRAGSKAADSQRTRYGDGDFRRDATNVTLRHQ